jgi:hypothetical protein
MVIPLTNLFHPLKSGTQSCCSICQAGACIELHHFAETSIKIDAFPLNPKPGPWPPHSGQDESGAMGYLLKDAQREELFTAMRTVAQGKAVFAPTVATRLLHQVRKPGREALSARELEVLALVARSQ